MRAPVWLALILIPLAHPGDPPEVSIRSAAWTPPAPVISAQSNLVESAVTVFDRQGRAVGGFTVADFTVTDNGKPQPITVFSEIRRPVAPTHAPGDKSALTTVPATEPVPPRNIALFFDDLHLASSGLPNYRQASAKLIARLQPGERLGIFTDSGTVTVDFTTDTAALLAALPRIKTHRDPAVRGMTTCPTLTDYSAFVIKEFIDEGEKKRAIAEVLGCHMCGEDPICAEGVVMDIANSVWENSRHYSTNALDVLKLLVAHLAKHDGDRVLILITEGFIDDDRMKPEIGAILNTAASDHIAINSLAVETSMGYRQIVLTNAMTDAASATGGQVIKNTNDLDGALGSLAAAPEVSYLLGFQAGNPDGKYHTLKVALPHREGLQVESRRGYFSAPPAKEQPTAQERINDAVLSHAVLTDVPASVKISPAPRQNGSYTVKIVVNIDAKHIEFAKQSGLHLQQLTFVTAIEDSKGNFITGKQAVMDLRVTPATLASMQATGIHATESFTLPKGSYTVRAVVREMVRNHIAAMNTPVQLR